MVEVFLWPLGSTVLDLHEEQRLQVPMERGMGVLCHISSLPNIYTPERLGSLGEPALRFVDRLVKAGIRYWQVLPVNPTDAFGSPLRGSLGLCRQHIAHVGRGCRGSYCAAR